jgi:hypothetical protein
MNNKQVSEEIQTPSKFRKSSIYLGLNKHQERAKRTLVRVSEGIETATASQILALEAICRLCLVNDPYLTSKDAYRAV